MKKKKSNKNLIFFAIESLALLLSILFLVVVSKITDNVQKVRIDDSTIVINEKKEEPQRAAEKVETAVEVKKETEKYRNIALFGVDSREKQLSSGTRTDTIIIASINETTKEVKLVSVFRDTYLNTGDDQYRKANAAYAVGGPEQAINMLNMNLDLDITDYVTIGFLGLMDTVDAVGGIEIDVTESEIEHLNNYQICMSEELGRNYIPITQPGLQTLNGLQATAYCRIRYTAGSDFKRTERQRMVIMQIVEKAKTMPLSDLNKIIDSILPKVSTSLDIEEMIAILPQLAQYEIVNSEGFPFESNRAVGTIGKKGSCVIPDSLDENVILLHELLFDEKEYVPTDSVKKYSDAILQETSPYL